jgi:hypothetical protein
MSSSIQDEAMCWYQQVDQTAKEIIRHSKTTSAAWSLISRIELLAHSLSTLAEFRTKDSSGVDAALSLVYRPFGNALEAIALTERRVEMSDQSALQLCLAAKAQLLCMLANATKAGPGGGGRFFGIVVKIRTFLRRNVLIGVALAAQKRSFGASF